MAAAKVEEEVRGSAVVGKDCFEDSWGIRGTEDGVGEGVETCLSRRVVNIRAEEDKKL